MAKIAQKIHKPIKANLYIKVEKLFLFINKEISSACYALDIGASILTIRSFPG
jgi:hypothetical protein